MVLERQEILKDESFSGSSLIKMAESPDDNGNFNLTKHVLDSRKYLLDKNSSLLILTIFIFFLLIILVILINNYFKVNRFFKEIDVIQLPLFPLGATSTVKRKNYKSFYHPYTDVCWVRPQTTPILFSSTRSHSIESLIIKDTTGNDKNINRRSSF